MRIEYKILLTTFCVAFIVFSMVHLIWLPFYWEHAPSQLVRPANLYSPNTWTLGIVFFSVLAAFSVLIIFELYSWLRKGLANEGVIFIATFFLTGMGLLLFVAFAGLRWGHPLGQASIPSWTWYQSKTGYATIMGIFILSFIGAVLSTVVYDVCRLARYAKKQLRKAKAP